eukprot:gnl/Chilomastix_cuspidata/3486.p1 GENE.gnl/Chilomastix_cuspidata/3486~~gnl/Chilomastix_cuspidata/3486.p1  ORF type:complete len:373 (-),score=107.47 gnl/Chilomastix_cuspidata/3486:605-1723(-)
MQFGAIFDYFPAISKLHVTLGSGLKHGGIRVVKENDTYRLEVLNKEKTNTLYLLDLPSEPVAPISGERHPASHLFSLQLSPIKDPTRSPFQLIRAVERELKRRVVGAAELYCQRCRRQVAARPARCRLRDTLPPQGWYDVSAMTFCECGNECAASFPTLLRDAGSAYLSSDPPVLFLPADTTRNCVAGKTLRARDAAGLRHDVQGADGAPAAKLVCACGHRIGYMCGTHAALMLSELTRDAEGAERLLMREEALATLFLCCAFRDARCVRVSSRLGEVPISVVDVNACCACNRVLGGADGRLALRPAVKCAFATPSDFSVPAVCAAALDDPDELELSASFHETLLAVMRRRSGAQIPALRGVAFLRLPVGRD